MFMSNCDVFVIMYLSVDSSWRLVIISHGVGALIIMNVIPNTLKCVIYVQLLSFSSAFSLPSCVEGLGLGGGGGEVCIHVQLPSGATYF